MWLTFRYFQAAYAHINYPNMLFVLKRQPLIKYLQTVGIDTGQYNSPITFGTESRE